MDGIYLEVFVHREGVHCPGVRGGRAPGRVCALGGLHHARLLVVAHPLLEEVGLALEGNQLHPVERVLHVVDLAAAERAAEPVRAKLDVLRHQFFVHPDQVAAERVADELFLHRNGALHDVVHDFFRQLALEHPVQQAGEVRVQALVARDQLVGEGEPRHQSSLLQPVDGAERPGEQDSLHAGEGHQPHGEAEVIRHPRRSPVGLLLDDGNRRDRVEQPGLLRLVVAAVLVDEERVGFGVDVLHGALEAVERARLRQLHLVREVHVDVLQDNTVTPREEGEDVLHEVLFGVGELLPVGHVLRQVDLLRRPKRCLVLLVHLPHGSVLDGEHDPSLRVFLQQHLILLLQLDGVREGPRLAAQLPRIGVLLLLGRAGLRGGVGSGGGCVCSGGRGEIDGGDVDVDAVLGDDTVLDHRLVGNPLDLKLLGQLFVVHHRGGQVCQPVLFDEGDRVALVVLQVD
mmetsp:Transcript_3386/g.7953  ORF Transcript_3386/g.7953 Transcript_3386/m.7953 type:complete len:458 (-) Transcript_3386:473-1846(-)